MAAVPTSLLKKPEVSENYTFANEYLLQVKVLKHLDQQNSQAASTLKGRGQC